MTAAALSLSLLLGVGTAPARTPASPDTLAWGAALEHDPSAPVHRTHLTDAVYEGLTTADRSDLAVLSASGAPVPHAVRPVPDPPRSAPRLSDVTWLEVEGPVDGSAPPVRTQLEVRPDGVLVGVRDGVVQARARTAIFELDPDLARPTHLVVTLAEDSPWVRVVAEGSADLDRWTRVGQAVLARLGEDTGRIEEDTVALAVPEDTRYLRLRAPRGSLPAVARIQVRRPGAHPAGTVLRTHRLSGTSLEDHTYGYALAGPYEVEQVRVRFGEENTVAEVTVSSAPEADGPWRVRHHGLAWRLGGERPTQSAPAAVGPTADTHWRVQVDPRGGGEGTTAPELELRTRPLEALWVSRGDGPFQLGWGSATVRSEDFDPQELLALAPAAGPAEARLLAPGPLAGEAALTPPPDGSATRRGLLWAVLLGSAAVLVGLSVSLLRSLDGDREGGGTPS